MMILEGVKNKSLNAKEKIPYALRLLNTWFYKIRRLRLTCRRFVSGVKRPATMLAFVFEHR